MKAKPSSKIANLSFLTGVHPEKLKVAKVVPIYKGGSKMQTSNYRPISLLSNLNKILEKSEGTFLSRKENVIYKQQFGFRPKHSTTRKIEKLLRR